MKADPKKQGHVVPVATLQPVVKLRQSFTDAKRALLIVSSVPRKDEWLVSVRYRAVGEKAIVGMPSLHPTQDEAKAKFEEYVEQAEQAGWVKKVVGGVNLPAAAFTQMPIAGAPSPTPQHV